MKKQLLIVFILFLSSLNSIVLNAQNAAFFNQGDRVCFIGNSITHAGEFHHNILLYYTTRFPESQVSFFNCGIAGDVTGGILDRMESDILIHKPTHAVIMIGMNDVSRKLYGEKVSTNLDTLQKRENALEQYRKNLDSIVRILVTKNIKIILQKPSIFDQTSKIEKANNLGVNDALKSCADFMETLSVKYKLQTVDYWTIMSEINKTMQQKDPKATIVGPDRIHPTSPGNLVMSYQFLKSTSGKNQQIISNILITNNLKSSQKESSNCQIINLKRKAKNVRFVVKENSLPFPTVESQQQGLERVPFTKELNTERLKIKNLSQGLFILKIDTTTVGIFKNTEFKEGINLAVNNKTPQYQQAMYVTKILSDLWEKEAKLRAIKYIEYSHLKNFEAINNVDSVRAYLEPLLKNKYKGSTYVWINSQLEKFVLNKPIEKQLEQQSDSLRTEAYKAAQPKEHLFHIFQAK